MITLTVDDLYPIITQADVTALTSKQIAGGADPITAAINDSLDLVTMYADPLTLPDNALRMIWRALAVSQLYIAVSVVPDKRKEERAWAIKTLEQIRDGKFPNIVADASKLPATTETDNGEAIAGQSAWGSRGEGSAFSLIS